MSHSGIFRVAGFAVIVAALNCALVTAAASADIKLTDPARSSFETAQPSITLRGLASADAPVASVRWVNQFGQRGVGTWATNAQGATSWRTPGIRLRSGVNLITVTVVDTANRSASMHVAVNRRLSKESQSGQALRVGTGVYKNRPVVFQVWNGHAVIEGDILVELGSFSKPNTAAGGDTALKATPNGIAIDYSSQFWPKVGGTAQVPYIVTVVGSASTTTLMSAIANFNGLFSGLIQFVPCSAPPNTSCALANYVNITVYPGGSGEGFSAVGMVGGEQLIQCGEVCTLATWLHEMGHTVGLLHEHQRPDRANYITLNLANADLPNVPGNFTLFSYDYQMMGLYDYASVMHYPAFSLSKAGRPVLESVPAGIPLSNDAGYSAGDVDQIKRLYGAAPSSVTVTTNPTGLQIIVDGTTYTAPQSFSFALNTTHTLALPADPQFTSPADGSTYMLGNWNDLGASTHTIFITPGAGTPASPATRPAVTVYQSNFIRLQPFAFLSPAAFPSGSGTVSVAPAPTAEFGGNFFADRTLVQLTYTKNAGYNFYDWFNLPYPPSDNPHSFYIQAPTTGAQAVFLATANPVTIVGETITGPNTWNPPLVGHVDNNFTFLPTAFSSTYEGWTASSTHTVSVDQTQSPVTTNVYYNWKSWSDGGAITHTITQPASGSQTVSASFAPYYASYTMPPPLTDPNPSCAGGVDTSPVRVVYPLNTAFGFYADGTSVVSTARPNPDFPAMVFAGWTGSLAGVVNPQTTLVHDQFVPTANFNLTSAPLAITSLAPASAVKSANALDVTVRGTGFTSTGTYAYWSDFSNFRANTFVSSTQLTLHLLAGDLNTTGGHDVIIGNYTTNAAQVTCGVITKTSFMVATTGRGKGVTTVTVTPASLSFATTQVGSATAPQTVTLKNTGTATLTIGAIALQGFGASSFALSSNSCGATLAAAASCTFGVAFAPAVAGALTGTVAVTDNATASPQTVALKGTGTQAKVTLTPATLTLATTAVGSTSAPQTVTLKNTGTAPLAIASFGTGGANATSFIIPTNACPPTLAVSASCTFTVAFAPTIAGALSGTIVITDNGVGSPQSMIVKGTGTAPKVSLTPATLTLATTAVGSTSAPQTVTLKNTGTAPLAIASIVVGGTNATSFATPTIACGSTLAAAASCTFTVTFTPTKTGALSGFVAVTDNATGSPHKVTLHGTGT